MSKSKSYIKKLVFASLISAFYAGLTYLSGFFGLGYGDIQFRVSEVLTVLPVFSPFSIVGLTVGCFISNIGSFNPLDLFFGTGATLIAAVFTYLLRNVKIKKIPFFSFLSPVIINGIIVGIELAVLTDIEISFAVMALSVAFGEAVVCFGLGIPFYFFLNKHKEIFSDF